MTNEEFLNFRNFWVTEDVDWAKLADEEGEDRIDGSDPAQRAEYLRLWGADDITLHMCYMDFIHHGRYELKFRNQGFDPSSFGKSSHSEDDGEEYSYFYNYVTSDDVYYYDAEFVSHSKLAYDVAIYANQFKKRSEFNDISDIYADIFHALKIEDRVEFEKIIKANGIELGSNGSMTLDCSQKHDVIFDLTVFPAV